MGPKRTNSNETLIWWGLVVVVAGVVGWILWRTATKGPASAEQKETGTNSFDVARATNVLRWLSTNTNSTVTAPTTVVTAVTMTNIPRATNRTMTNVVVAKPVITNPPPVVVTNPPVAPKIASGEERPVKTTLEAQIALARKGISSGPIDGVAGSQSRAAIKAFQQEQGFEETGILDAQTRAALLVAEPILTTYVVTPGDLARLRPIPETWLEKSEQPALEYETILELVAERHQASQPLIKSLNPSINWTNVAANTVVKVPFVPKPSTKEKAAFVLISLSKKTLEAYGTETNLLAHFPCSIAARVEKRPEGQLFVAKAAENPNYSFDPEVFPESEEAQRLGRKLIIPPGPNNPVGTAWIGLDKPGYGIHGTPKPEQVGRTESHGCFRLANWNAEFLLKIVWAGMPVYVEP